MRFSRKVRTLAASVGFAVSVVLMPIVTAPAAGAATIYEAEPNDDATSSTPLPVGATIEGSMQGSSWDHDYYRVTLPKAGRVVLTLTFEEMYGDDKAYELSVFGASDEEFADFTLKAGHFDGSWLKKQSLYLPAGTYLIDIYGMFYYPTWGKSYQLRVDLKPGVVEQEPNDSGATATRLPMGTTVLGSALSGGSGDTDYYSFEVPRAGRVAVNLTFPKMYGDEDAYQFAVLDRYGQTEAHFIIDAGYWDGRWLSSQSIILPKGTYLIELYGFFSYPTWGKTYQLSVGYPLKTATPVVTGKAKVGKKLKVKAGTWTKGTKLSYQWYAGKKMIKGATAPKLTLTKTLKGKKVSVHVTGKKAQYLTTATASKKVTVTK